MENVEELAAALRKSKQDAEKLVDGWSKRAEQYQYKILNPAERDTLLKVRLELLRCIRELEQTCSLTERF